MLQAIKNNYRPKSVQIKLIIESISQAHPNYALEYCINQAQLNYALCIVNYALTNIRIFCRQAYFLSQTFCLSFGSDDVSGCGMGKPT